MATLRRRWLSPNPKPILFRRCGSTRACRARASEVKAARARSDRNTSNATRKYGGDLLLRVAKCDRPNITGLEIHERFGYEAYAFVGRAGMCAFLRNFFIVGAMVACRADTSNSRCDDTPIVSSGTLRACTARRIVGRGLGQQPSVAERNATAAANALYKARHPARLSLPGVVRRVP
jgi:hypothetical protein